MQLGGKVSIVTGSSTGIGEAIARRFAREGASVMVHGRDVDRARAVADNIVASGGSADFTASDIADPVACAELVSRTVARFGKIDILVNNAANVTRSNIDTTTSDLFDNIMAVNVRAPLLLAQAAIPYFRKQNRGSILNIGSANGYSGEPRLLAYSVSKGALTTLTRNLANTHATEGIRVNQIVVGWTLTPNEYEMKVSEGLPEDWPSNVPKDLAPFGRLQTPDEIAYWAVVFCSDEAKMVNGAVLDVEQFPCVLRNPLKEGE